MPDPAVLEATSGVLNFTVDSALLRELGERLVGRPSIALAELIKNSYDADATTVTVEVDENRIVVSDNGVGMDLPTFRDFWMRIGTPHKQTDIVSPKYRRRLTGSKGVGRLSTQLLARQLRVETVSISFPGTQLEALVDWPAAAKAGELTLATARYWQKAATVQLPGDALHGTRIELSGLNHAWSGSDLEELAREIWWLQPPFRTSSRKALGAEFRVTLTTGDQEAFDRFRTQMNAYLNLWEARLVGELMPLPGGVPVIGNRSVDLSLEFSGDNRPTHWRYSIPNCRLAEAEFEIRIFNLKNRQPYGLRVGEVRDYLRRFGGVHVYDGGFHLPYYGPDTDWLRVEQDHSHRLSRSRLLPEALQVKEGLTHLPTNSRVLGVVRVDTSVERQVWEGGSEDPGPEHLMIQISRDRLVDNTAFSDLQGIVRTALDYYAVQEARRSAQEVSETAAVESFSSRAEAVEEIIGKHEDIDADIRRVLKAELKEVFEAAESDAEKLAREAGLLGALATAGISAVAYEHEITKQYSLLEEIAGTIGHWSSKRPTADQIQKTAQELYEWLETARELRSMFVSLVDESERSEQYRFLAKELIERVIDRLRPLLRGIDVDSRLVDPTLRLPLGRFSEWSALFQNLFTNAANAMLDRPLKVLGLASTTAHGQSQILVQDTGSGVDLARAQELFKPFARQQEISPERRRLGLGGTGLGLTIVRMISLGLNCSVEFASPRPPFRTAVAVSWRESKRK